MKKLLLLLLLVGLLVGCVRSGYEKYYTPVIRENEVLEEVEVLKDGEKAQVFKTENIQQDVNVLRSKNYAVIGYSFFNGRYEDDNLVLSQAKKIGATIILLNRKHTGTNRVDSYNMVTTTDTSTSEYMDRNGKVRTRRTVTYSDTPVPYSSYMEMYDQTAVFFAKSLKPVGAGVLLKALTPLQRQTLGRNTGAMVSVVVEKSPAFFANILAGDILVAINKEVLATNEEYESMMKSAGRDVIFTVIRQGKEFDIKVGIK
ncbi:MAG: PDZ domain-containing protein [Lentisphaeria bacterium]